MKAIILAGGKGLRFGSVTKSIPKPMVMIGNKPMLWHILNLLSSNGIKDFIICVGYKGEIIKKYVSSIKENWNIQCVDTGLNTLTGKRIGLIKHMIKDQYFLMTYGDGLANIDLKKLLKTHIKKKKLVQLPLLHQYKDLVQ